MQPEDLQHVIPRSSQNNGRVNKQQYDNQLPESKSAIVLQQQPQNSAIRSVQSQFQATSNSLADGPQISAYRQSQRRPMQQRALGAELLLSIHKGINRAKENGLRTRESIATNQTRMRESIVVERIQQSPAKNAAKSSLQTIADQPDQYLQQSQQQQSTADRAVQLVASSNGQFTLVEEAVQIVRECKASSVCFCVVVGLYRTGKSFLLNRLLDFQDKTATAKKQATEKFKVDSQTSACTQGIWLYSRPLYNAETDTAIFLLDSEGSNSLEKNETHDTKIFALAALLASVFVLNSFGAIDEQSIQQLNLTARVAQQLGAYTASCKLVWVLRDFILEIRDPSGQQIISANRYLEFCLRENNQEQSRKRLREMFTERECITLPRPYDNESQLTRGEAAVRQNPPSAQFQEGVSKLRECIIASARPKNIRGTAVNGSAMLDLLSQALHSLNKENILPDIQSAWENVQENTLQRLLSDCLDTYDKKINAFFDKNEENEESSESVQLPLASEKLYLTMKDLRDTAIDTFYAGIAQARINSKQYYVQQLKQLTEYIALREEELIRYCMIKAEQNNITALAHSLQIMKSNFDTELYRFDNLEQFLVDFQEMILDYQKTSVDLRRADVLIDFLSRYHMEMLRSLKRQTDLKIRQVEDGNQQYANELQQLRDEYEIQVGFMNQKDDNREFKMENVLKENELIKKDNLQKNDKIISLTDDVNKLKSENWELKQLVKEKEQAIAKVGREEQRKKDGCECSLF